MVGHTGHVAAVASGLRRRSVAVGLMLALLLLAGGVSLYAQVFAGRGRNFPILRPERRPGGEYVFARLQYTSNRSEPGGSGWRTDYPDADANFMIRFAELTKAPVSMLTPDYPNHVVLEIMDERLFDYPFLFASDVGTMLLSQPEVERLRTYFDKGGFLWVDDFWGPVAWEQWEREISRVLPPLEFPIIDIPMDHPIVAALHRIDRIPQIPNIGFWERSGGQTSERYELSSQVNFRGIADEKGRLKVIMTHNTDIADGWEREAMNPAFFQRFSVEAYAIGLTFMVYALTH